MAKQIPVSQIVQAVGGKENVAQEPPCVRPAGADRAAAPGSGRCSPAPHPSPAAASAPGGNVFPSDIEAVIRELDGVTGEYLIRVFEKDFTCKYSVEIEKNSDNPASDDSVAETVSAALKARIGVKPYKVVVHPDGGLDTRSEHKSKRIIDERKLDYTI